MSRFGNTTNPFEEEIEDVDDDTFLANSRKSSAPHEQLQSFHERKRIIEERTINSTEHSIRVLRDSEQIGIATAEELIRQREKLEKTDKQLDEINATLRVSQRHINGIKSVFSSLKNYISGKSEASPPSGPSTSASTKELDGKVGAYDRFENHPATRIRDLDYKPPPSQGSGSKDFSARLDANLHEMSSNISRLKGLASEMTVEIDSQNDLIGDLYDKADQANMTVGKQNKDMNRLLKK